MISAGRPSAMIDSASSIASAVLPVAVAPAMTMRGGAPTMAVSCAMAYPHVFAPLRLRHRTLANRITFGAHTANMAVDGLPGERHLAYYRERALGGAAMIVVEPVPVHRTAVLTRGNFRHGDDAVIEPFRRVADACRAADPDVVMIQQLYHVGQHGDADNSFAPNWSPSGLPSYHDSDGSHAMSELEIEAVIDGFVAAAGRVHASRLRRHRGLRRLPRTRRPVLDAVVEPPNGSLGRIVRGADAVFGCHPPRDP